MSKEEIINATVNPMLPSAEGVRTKVREAMDQYAEQESILFGEWLKLSAFSHSPYMVEPIIWLLTGNYLMLHPDMENKEYSTTELFQLYKTQQTKTS